MAGAEGVGVLHDELPAAHEAKARAELVAELILNLVKRHGKLFIRTQLVAHEVGEGLLVGGAEDEVALVAVVQAHKLGAIRAVAARLLPKLGRGDDGDLDFLGADALHLVADDILDFLDDAPAKRKVAVQAGSSLADHTGTEQELMAHELGLGGILLEGGGIEPRHLLITLHVLSNLPMEGRVAARLGFSNY